MAGLPLEGIRVLEAGHIWAGPAVGTCLADLGAEVIKVESITRPDLARYVNQVRPEEPGAYNRGILFRSWNRNKLDLTLDLNKEKGFELLKELIKKSDVWIDNWSPRVLVNLGLEYQNLKELNPAIIMLSLTCYGNSGPRRQWQGFAAAFEQLSGRVFPSGYHNGPPMMLGIGFIPTDAAAGQHGAFAVLAALAYRRRTGKGQYIDLSCTEANIVGMGGEMAFRQLVPKRLDRYGNRSPYVAPQGVYRCAGEDRWVTISVTNNDEWQKLKVAMGCPTAADKPEFNEPAGRWRNHDEIDEIITVWTSRLDHIEVQNILQRAGVPAGAALDGRESLANPHLNDRSWYNLESTAELGVRRIQGSGFKLSKTPMTMKRRAPDIGEHNDHVLRTVLGLSAEEVAVLAEEKIIGRAPLGEVGVIQ